LSIIHRNTHHLQTLVNDVLDLARIEAAQMTVIFEEADPAAVLQEAVNTAHSLAEMNGLKLMVQIEAKLPHLWLDATRIRQVLFNLLNNAVRFTPHGTITVSVRSSKGEVIFSVADTGVGIAAQDIPRLFKEFEQLDGSTRRRHGGAGLGLAISRRFVELHGGRIWVESQIGVGSVFSFSLPIVRDQSGFDGANVALEASNNMPSAVRQEQILLLMTRSPSSAALLTHQVQGSRTVVVPDLEQAKASAQQLLPQCIVIDTASQLLKPEVLQALAQEWNLPNVSMIACSLSGKDDLPAQLAVDGYLVKPVSIQNVRDVVRRFGDVLDSILIIDEDQDFVRMMTRILESSVRRYKVISAHNGAEGIALFMHHKPGLVFLHLRLPDMSGIGLIERLHALPSWHNTPIIVISGRDQSELPEISHDPIIITQQNGIAASQIIRIIQDLLD
jgi:DNA-binding response OmpR family regulator